MRFWGGKRHFARLNGAPSVGGGSVTSAATAAQPGHQPYEAPLVLLLRQL